MEHPLACSIMFLLHHLGLATPDAAEDGRVEGAGVVRHRGEGKVKGEGWFVYGVTCTPHLAVIHDFVYKPL